MSSEAEAIKYFENNTLPPSLDTAIKTGQPAPTNFAWIILVLVLLIVVVWGIYWYWAQTTNLSNVALDNRKIQLPLNSQHTITHLPSTIVPMKNNLVGMDHLIRHVAFVKQLPEELQMHDKRYKALFTNCDYSQWPLEKFVQLCSMILDTGFDTAVWKLPPLPKLDANIPIDIYEFMLRLYGESRFTNFTTTLPRFPVVDYRFPLTTVIESPLKVYDRVMSTSLQKQKHGKLWLESPNKVYDYYTNQQLFTIPLNDGQLPEDLVYAENSKGYTISTKNQIKFAGSFNIHDSIVQPNQVVTLDKLKLKANVPMRIEAGRLLVDTATTIYVLV